jgi:hypothetical protein
MRAITHVDGKAIGSSRRARRGRRLRVEDDHGAFGGTPISSSPNCVAEDVGGPSSCDRARMPGWASRWGRGSLGHGRSRDVRPWPPVCARFRPRLRSSARARTVRSRVVRGSSGTEGGAGACSRADARVRLSRLRPGDRHTSPNQAYGTPLLRLPPKSLLSGLGAPLGFPVAERGARSKNRTIRPGDAPRRAGFEVDLSVYSPLSIAAMPPVSLAGLRWAMAPSDR